MIYDTVITGVTSKVVNRKSDNRPITIYEITDANNTKWTTSRRELANEANRLINTNVTVQGRQEQKGNFMNYYLEDLRSKNGAAPVMQPQPTPSPPPPPSPGPPPVQQQAPLPQHWTPNEKDFNIMRQTAAKVSANLSTTPAEFWSNVDDLVVYFTTAEKPERFNRFVPPAITQPLEGTGNQFIPPSYEDDPGPLDQPGYTDDDIPF